MTTRRRFLRHSSLVAAGAALLPAGVLAAPVGSRATALAQLHFAAFATNVGTTFWAVQDRRPATGLELVRVRAWPPPVNAAQAAAPDAWNEKFSLLLRGSPGQALGQDTYLFEHGRMGRFEMFIVPVGPTAEDAIYYEAIFNRPAVR